MSRLIKVKLALVDKDHLIASSYCSDASGQWEQKLLSITAVKRTATIDRAFERGGFTLTIDDTPDYGQATSAYQTMMSHATNRKIGNRIVTVYIYKPDGVTIDETITAAINSWDRADNKFILECVQEFTGKMNSVFDVKTILRADWLNAPDASIGQIIQYPAGVISSDMGEMPLWRVDNQPHAKYMITWSDPLGAALVTSIDAAYDQGVVIPPADYTLTRDGSGWEYLELTTGYPDSINVWINLTASISNPVVYLRAKLLAKGIILVDDGDGGASDFQDFCTTNTWTVKALSEATTPRMLIELWCKNFDCFWYIDAAEAVHIKHIDWSAITADATLTEKHFLNFKENVSRNDFANSIRVLGDYDYSKRQWGSEYIYDSTGGDILPAVNRIEEKQEYLLGVFGGALHPAHDKIKYIDHPIQTIYAVIDIDLYESLDLQMLSIIDATHYLQIGANGNYLILTEEKDTEAATVVITAYKLWGGTYTNPAPTLSTTPITGSVNNLPMPVIFDGKIDGDMLPPITATKKGGVPAVTAQPVPHFLRDTGDFEHIVQNDVSGLETTATPEFSGLGIETAGSINKINLIEAAQLGIATGPRQVFHDADKLLELLDADVNIGDTPVQPGTGGTWSTAYDTADTSITCFKEFLGKLYAGSSEGNIYVYDGVSWSLLYNSDATEILCFCIFDGSLYAGTGEGAKLLKTTNGVDWSLIATLVTGTTHINSLVTHNGFFYAATSGNSSGNRAKVFFSLDGTTWNISFDGYVEHDGWHCYSLCIHNNAVHVMSTSTPESRIYRLSPAGSWALIYTWAFPLGEGRFYVWNNAIYYGRTNGKIYKSSFDVATWTEVVDLGASAVYDFVEYDGKLLAGYGSKVHESFNGEDWATEFYSSSETTINSLVVFDDVLYIGTGSAGKVLAYTDSTYVPSCNLKVYGHEILWGQFRPGDAAGIIGSLLMANSPDYPVWLPPGVDGEYIAAPATPGDAPVYQVIPASDVVNTPAGNIAATNVQAAINELDAEKLSIVNLLCYENEILSYENEVLNG